MRPHFTLPRRVSRLYPIFSLILLVNSSILFYAWQSAQIKIESYSSYDEREKALHQQIDALLADQKKDRAQLSLQNQRVAEATAKLDSLQQDLATKEASLKSAEDQLTKQQAQLSQNSSELEKLRSRPPLFSFQNDSTTIANIEEKQSDIKQLVSDAYSYIQDLYGAPYLLNSIVITFVDDFSIQGSAGEIVIQNGPKGITINIHLKDFDKTSFQDINTVIHEIIHGFHGVAVFESSALEEGMTVAATDAIMERMASDGKIPRFNNLYISVSKEQYQQWNNTLSIPADNNAFYASSDISKIYQVLGYAWWQLYKADPTVFKLINAAYYPKVQQGLNADTATALEAIRTAIKTVDGQSIDTYLAANKAFNPN